MSTVDVTTTPPTGVPRTATKDVETFFNLIFRHMGRVTVAVKEDKGPRETYFDNPDAALQYVIDQSNRRTAGCVNIYSSVAEPSLELVTETGMNRRNQRWFGRSSEANNARRVFLLLDIDPRKTLPPELIETPEDERPDYPATAEEKQAAITFGFFVVAYLTKMGFPRPLIIGDSGNGFQAIYLVDLTAEQDHLVGDLLDILAEQFKGENGEIDTTCRDRARLFRLFGTLNMRGTQFKNREYSFAKILEANPETQAISPGQLSSFINAWRKDHPGETVATPASSPELKTTMSVDEMKTLLTSKGIAFTARKDEALGIGEVLDLAKCPFNSHYCEPNPAIYIGIKNKLWCFKCFAKTCVHDEGKNKGKKFQFADFCEKLEIDNPNAKAKAGKKKLPIAEEIYKLALDTDTFFRDMQDVPYVEAVQEDGSTAIMLVGDDYQDLLSNRWQDAHDYTLPITPQQLSEAAKSLRSLARRSKDKRAVHVRSGKHKGALYIDLLWGNDEVIAITENEKGVWSWDIATKPTDLFFVRSPLMAPLPKPQKGADPKEGIRKLQRLLNVPDNQFPIIAPAIIGMMVPWEFMPAGFFFTARGGHAKTSTALSIMDYIDPTLERKLPLLPREERDFVVRLFTSSVGILNNQPEKIDKRLAALICSFMEGAYYEMRRLFTDDSMQRVYLKRPMLITSVDDVFPANDSRRRFITVEMPEFNSAHPRQDERDLKQWREEDAGAIYTALLDGIVAVLNNKTDVKLQTSPSLIDFVKMASKLESFYGFPDGCMERIFDMQGADLSYENLSNNRVTSAILRHIEEGNGPVEGTSAEIAEKFKTAIEQNTTKTLEVKEVSYALRDYAEDFQRIGIKFERRPRENHHYGHAFRIGFDTGDWLIDLIPDLQRAGIVVESLPDGRWRLS